jgi:uncharacterized Zn-binding protein involved in type VI secretion
MVTVLVPHVGGPILPPCAVTVIIGGMPAARVGDMCVCVGPPDVIAKGSAGVFIMGMAAARIGDPTVHGGVIVSGFPTVIIGEMGGGGGGGSAGSAENAIADLPLGPLPEGAAQAAALKEAAKNGTPFCEQCAAG